MDIRKGVSAEKNPPPRSADYGTLSGSREIANTSSRTIRTMDSLPSRGQFPYRERLFIGMELRRINVSLPMVFLDFEECLAANWNHLRIVALPVVHASFRDSAVKFSRLFFGYKNPNRIVGFITDFI